MIDKLIGELTGGLNLDQTQAKGGLGILLGVAKEGLGGDQFSSLVDGLGAGDIASSLTGSSGGGGIGGLVSGALSSLGGSDSGLGQVAKLASGFKDLGIDLDTAQKFIPIVLNFVETNLGGELKQTLSNFLPEDLLK